MAAEKVDAEKVINLLRLQKHDFLNHLQVISGYLQLKKPERALQCAWDSMHEIEHSGSIMTLKDPRLVVTLLVKASEARHDCIDVHLASDTDLSHLALPEDALVSFCTDLFGALRNALEKPEEGGDVELSFAENDAEYCLVVSIAPLEKENGKFRQLQVRTLALLESLPGTGCRLETERTRDGLQMFINFPKKREGE